MSCGESNPNNDITARVMVWKFVENRLKDPSSAKFGSCKMENTSSGSWKTDCYVDSKNGFGGTERLDFKCEINYNSNGSWDLINLTFE